MTTKSTSDKPAEASPVPSNVYQLIHAVSADLARQGIGKSRENEQQHYKFRGIDEVLNALSPVLVKHGLVIIPRVVQRTATERTTTKGTVMFYVVIEAEFDFVAIGDKSTHTARTIGEAMDSADKATNKAMSAAYKYAAFLTFCIPIEGDGDRDADATTPEPVKPVEASSRQREVGKGPLIVSGVTERTGETKGKFWRLYVVRFSDGREGSTLDKAIAEDAARCGKDKTPVDPVLEPAKRPGSFKLVELARMVERVPGEDG